MTTDGCNVILGHVIDGLERKYGNKEEHEQLQSGGDSVRDEIADSAKNAARNADAGDYS